MGSLRMLELSLSLTGGPDMRAFVGRAMAVLGEAYLARGERERAQQAVRAAFAPLAEVGDATGHAIAHRLLGQAELALGNLDEASRHVAEARGRFERLGAHMEVALTRLTAARIAERREDAGQVTRELEAARHVFVALEVPRWLELAREGAGKLVRGS